MHRLSCFVAISVLSASLATFADPISLKPMVPVGTRWNFDGTSAFTLDNQATLNGQSQSFTIKSSQHRVGHGEVVAATDGVPTSIRVTFDDASSDTTTNGENPVGPPFPYAGKTVTITRGADGQIKDDFTGDATPQSVADLHGLLDQELVFLPTHPVNVGDEWAADPATLSRIMELAGDDKAGMTLKLLGTKSIDGRKVAELKVSTAVMRKQGDIQSQLVMQGTALVDLKTGQTIRSDLAGTIKDNGEQAGQGPDGAQASYHIEGSGTISIAGTTTLIAPDTMPGTSSAGTATNGGGNNSGDANAASGAAALNPLGAAAASDPFAGQFTDGKLTLDGGTRDGKFAGALTLGSQKYNATATIKDQSLDGAFDSSGHSFAFTAKLQGDTMTFITGGKTYTLNRAAPPAPANPLGASDASPAILKLPGYAVAVSTDAGKTLTVHKNVSSVADSFKAVFPELAHYFDDRPTLIAAFEDTRDHKSGTATFTAHLNNQMVRGIVACHLGDAGGGSDIAVTYCRADAGDAQWARLLNPASASAGSAAEMPTMTVYQFPDNTGSISLAQGWTTQAQSDLSPIVIKGPADQTITIGASFSALTPDSQIVQMMRQNDAWSIHTSGKALPHPPMLIAPFSGPAEAMTALIPQLNAAAAPGKPKITIDHVEQVQSLRSFTAGGKAGVLTYNVTKTDAQGQQTHFRASSEVDCSPPSWNGGWMVSVNEAAAPAASFDHDLPIMLAIMRSRSENAKVCQQIISANGKAIADTQQQLFENGQKAHRDQMASYDAHNKAWARQEVQNDRNNADFIEVIRGERAVVDTTTGEKGYADLSDAGKVVDELNAHDPGRYQQLPLRDELYPVGQQ